MKDLTKVLFWYGLFELARGPFKKLNGPLDHLIFFMQRTIQDFHVKNNFIDIFKYSDILLDILSHTLRYINSYFETYYGTYYSILLSNTQPYFLTYFAII